MSYKNCVEVDEYFEWFELMKLVEEIATVGRKLRTCGYTAIRNIIFHISEDTSRQLQGSIFSILSLIYI